MLAMPQICPGFARANACTRSCAARSSCWRDCGITSVTEMSCASIARNTSDSLVSVPTPVGEGPRWPCVSMICMTSAREDRAADVAALFTREEGQHARYPRRVHERGAGQRLLRVSAARTRAVLHVLAL